MKKTANPWSVPVAVEDIPDTGMHVVIDAPPAVRAEVGELAGLRDLPQLSAVFDLTRQGSGVQVTGQVNARVGQTCVVTLEPIENVVAEAVDLKFAATSGSEAAPKRARKRPLDGDEPPEPLFNGRLDLGALATEFLILGIDPYPRKEGVEFAPPKDENPGEHPFAALQSLKKNLGGGQS
jgi:uncharacterized metal-binding protein YceD (DUF177 family)